MLGAFRVAMTLPILLAVTWAVGGCGESKNETRADKTPPGVAGAPVPPPGEPVEAAPIPDVTEGTGASPTIKEIMTKLTKGPNSLTPVIGKELEAEDPPWETLQPRAKEFAQLAAAIGRNDPPKGHKASWEKLTSAYAEWASDLDKAAQVKDRNAALEAHGKLAGSCMACHREHREMRKGMGGPPGPGRPRMPPGGPPPGGPSPN
jgi:hypothetical protein